MLPALLRCNKRNILKKGGANKDVNKPTKLPKSLYENILSNDPKNENVN
jgi:hypothetical protein